MRNNNYANQSVCKAETQGILMSVFGSMEIQQRQVIPYTIDSLEAEIQAPHSAKRLRIAVGA
jgi:hypothetical protein